MRTKFKTSTLLGLALALTLVSSAHSANQNTPPVSQRGRAGPSGVAGPARALVVDDRLSVLRRDPDLRSQAIQRLRVGRQVYITGSGKTKAGEPTFFRVAVTRRTRGWIHASAVAIPGRTGEDRRVLQLAETASEGLDRIVLCLLLRERFKSSSLVPRALILMAEEAERAAATLTRRAARRVATISPGDARTGLRDYYLNDAALDRFSKLRISFDFDQVRGEYVYDGAAYRAIVRRFPASDSAIIARQRLAILERRLARRE